MKISELIDYLTKYRLENGDVDLDVEIGGSPKTKPPKTKPPETPQTPILTSSEFAELFKIINDSKKSKNDDYIEIFDPPVKKNPNWYTDVHNMYKKLFLD